LKPILSRIASGSFPKDFFVLDEKGFDELELTFNAGEALTVLVQVRNELPLTLKQQRDGVF